MPGQPPFDPALLGRLPGVLAIPLKDLTDEGRPELRLHRLCDAFEILRANFATILAVAEVRLPDDPDRLPASLVEKLGPQIETPTLARCMATSSRW